MGYLHSRRKVLASLSALGAASLVARSVPAAEPPPETTTIRISTIAGFTDWRFFDEVKRELKT